MDEIWVVDTSSIIEVRRKVLGNMQAIVYNKLSDLVNNDVLVYPIQVFTELERYSNPKSKKPDRPFEWAKLTKERATHHGTDFEKLKAILEHPQVSKGR